MAEEGKKNIQITTKITNHKRWGTSVDESALSTSDKAEEEDLNIIPQQTSEPKANSVKELEKPEKINVREAKAKELGVSTGTVAKADYVMKKAEMGELPKETIDKLRKGEETDRDAHIRNT